MRETPNGLICGTINVNDDTPYRANYDTNYLRGEEELGRCLLFPEKSIIKEHSQK